MLDFCQLKTSFIIACYHYIIIIAIILTIIITIIIIIIIVITITITITIIFPQTDLAEPSCW